MRKISKWLLLGPVTTTVPFALMSASTTSDSTNNNNNGDSGENNNISPEFDQFKGIKDNIQSEQLGKIIDQGILDLHNEANSYLSDSAKEAADILKGMYIKKVATYLEKNKAAIIANPRDNGFFMFYPEILATSKSFKSMVLNFDSQSFQQVLINSDTNAQNPYLNLPLVPEQISDLKEYTSEVLTNTLTKDQFTAKIDDYFKNLQGEFTDIFDNDDDIPTFEDTSITFNSNGDFNLNNPKGYSSWDDYIKSKFSQRFLMFDLSQNSKEDDSQDKPPSPIIPPLPQVVDPAISNNEIENIPSLNPIISSTVFDTYTSLTSAGAKQNFINKFNKNPNKNSDNYFFFYNSINTRYKYSVTELKLVKDKLIADVKIQDQIATNNIRTYSYEVNVLPSKQDTLATQAAYNLIKNIFIQLYNAMGVMAKIDYQQLVDQELANVLFNMISRAVRNSFQAQYLKDLNEIIATYGSSVSSIKLEDNLDSTFGEKINYFILSTLKNTLINNVYYFALLPNAFVNTYNLIVQGLKNKLDIVKANILVLNEYYKVNYFGLDWINQGLDVLNDDISFLKGLAINNSFDLYSQYQEYTNLTQRINKTFRDLYIILNQQPLANSADYKQQITQLRDSIFAMPQIPYTQPAANKTLLYTFAGISLGLFILLSLAGSTLTLTNKKYKIKNTKTKIILLGSLASLFLILAIILFTIGLGGL
ncbi:MSC_0620 family F1-like ATPase-associated subunit [Mycoplasmopsis verecunda]|uniref:Uncharacterized protein n=1 Tax=Mycoplasmopsis verecunda TaxID=171291 RepID=A0A1T4KMD8_9BACT|nr:hypothetical protein [Mycoplasmopsis verecunda]WPB54296.1 hypothetical protein SAM46_02290 [Mycoplasmopsis verecunda]SJZ43533.1 hypothetical protein SAMN02745154_00113 [Mycoplasmopsis verecunda]